jgi:hypothetical protein
MRNNGAATLKRMIFGKRDDDSIRSSLFGAVRHTLTGRSSALDLLGRARRYEADLAGRRFDLQPIAFQARNLDVCSAANMGDYGAGFIRLRINRRTVS